MISIIVSTLGRSQQIETLLDSLVHQEFQDFEVIIVNQNEDAHMLPAVDPRRWPYPVRYIHTPGQRGVSRGRNAGLAHARGDIVLFPDDDCWYPAWFLSKGIALLDTHHCASVSGRAADETGRSINGRFETSPAWIERGNVWTTQIEWVVLFRKSALQAVGGYNEDIGIGASTPWQADEGHDVTLRLMEAGFRTYYDPSLYGFHALLNKADIATNGKGRAYGRGLGYVLKQHHYGVLTLCYWLFRPLAGAFLSFLRTNWSESRYYANVMLGRLEGWCGKTFAVRI